MNVHSGKIKVSRDQELAPTDSDQQSECENPIYGKHNNYVKTRISYSFEIACAYNKLIYV